ncbi:hypothetical protein ALC62_09462 [Cyphomyrmex costatus]|uniref:Uncharacterized protein n=1 Tax=Cyphomyrmex costatus TaxID=456900 RepID=A0A195CIF0_9HYME|nr:hypothetical protein ALC62_09462 [Cyphomyrmex costatus]
MRRTKLGAIARSGDPPLAASRESRKEKETGMSRGGPTKVRPRAELVCRKRRFPANALVRNARYSAKKNSLVGGGTNGDDRDSKASRGSGERGSPGHSNGVSSPLHGRTVRFLCSVKATREIIAPYRKWPLLDPPYSTWEGPPSPSHHLHHHLRETETTEDERVAFYASKSDEERGGDQGSDEVRRGHRYTEGTWTGVVGGTPRVIELPGRSGVAQVR